METVKCLRKKHRKSYVPGHKVSSLTFTSTVKSFSKEKIFLPFRTKKVLWYVLLRSSVITECMEVSKYRRGKNFIPVGFLKCNESTAENEVVAVQ